MVQHLGNDNNNNNNNNNDWPSLETEIVEVGEESSSSNNLPWDLEAMLVPTILLSGETC